MLGSEPFLYLFGVKNGIFCKFLYLVFCCTNLLTLALKTQINLVLTRLLAVLIFKKLQLFFACGAIGYNERMLVEICLMGSTN